MTTNINITQTWWRLLSAVGSTLITLVAWLGYMALCILCYIINGDASGLTDEEIRMVDEAMRKNNIEIVSPRYNEDMCTEPYFSHYPFFGLPTEVEDCDIIYHE